ncbi:putative plasmid stabilization-like protein from prophage [Escherichia coli]|nr:putative plasmid stabilization-like protein from prophage [Escherichia coli]
MLPILWLPSARDDLRQIVAYIAKENRHAARRLKIRIETCVCFIRTPVFIPFKRQSVRLT